MLHGFFRPARLRLRRAIFAASVLAGGVSLSNDSRAEDWPAFRGPRGDGTSLETDVTLDWARDRNVAWSVEVPGAGHASPVVMGDLVVVASATGEGEQAGHDRGLFAFDARTGTPRWNVVVVRTYDLEPLHAENNHASSTPAMAPDRIYTSFYANGRAHFAAHDFEGRPVWEVSPLRYESEHGYEHTPLVVGDLLVLSVDQFADPAILALDRETGETRWRIPTNARSCSNVAPALIAGSRGAVVVTSGNNTVRGIDPATGEVRWTTAGPTNYCVSGIAHGQGIALVAGGYPGRRAIAIRLEDSPGADADPAARAGEILWEQKRQTPYVPSPVYYDGSFYWVNDTGIATCVEAATGEIRWQERLEGVRHRASLVLVAGRILATDEEGTTTVILPSREGLRIERTNRLDEFMYATPAISNGRVFLRTGTRLLCIARPEAR